MEWTKEKAIKFVSENGWNILKLPVEFQLDEEIAFLALKKDDSFKLDLFSKLPRVLKNNKEFALKAIKFDCFNYKYLPKKLQKDKELALATVKQEGQLFENIPFDLREDIDISRAAALNDPTYLNGINWELMSDRAFIIKVLKTVKNSIGAGHIMLYCDPAFKDDKEIILLACKRHGQALTDASERLKDDPDVVIQAYTTSPEIAKNGWASDRWNKIAGNSPDPARAVQSYLDAEKLKKELETKLVVKRKINKI